jgi:hypothetical protein
MKDVPKLPLVVFLAFALLLGFGLSASATTITLNFNTLPSAQGWTFSSTRNITEGSAFSVNGSTLTQNTIGDGRLAAAFYEMAGLFDPTKPFSMEVNVRILGEEAFGGIGIGAFGFLASDANFSSLVYVDVGEVSVLDANFGTGYQQMPIDGTLFHDYLFYANPGSGTWTLDIDGAFAMTGSINTINSGALNAIRFGDVNALENGNAEIAKYVFTQNSPVPEPTSLSLIGIGLFGAWLPLRRK